MLNLMTFSALLVSSLLSNVIFCSHLSGNKRISLTVVAGNHCVFYNKLHFRTFFPRRKVHWSEGLFQGRLWDPHLQDDVEWGGDALFRELFPKSIHFSKGFISKVSLD